MNKLQWYNYDDTNASTFKVYRSVPGFSFLFSDLAIENPLFRFCATSPDIQEITVDTTSIDTAVSSLNTGRGIQAVKDTAGTSIIVRLTARKNPRLKLLKSDFIEGLSMNPQIIVPGLNFTNIGTVPFASGSDAYEFDDDDGSYLDSYYVTSVLAGVESIPSIIQCPVMTGISFCVVEARFTDIQGRPVRGIQVTAEPAVLDESGLSTNKITVTSDAYGRVSFPLLQCQQYVLHAPAIGYNQFIDVPQENFIDLTKWPANTKPEFSPFGDPP